MRGPDSDGAIRKWKGITSADPVPTVCWATMLPEFYFAQSSAFCALGINTSSLQMRQLNPSTMKERTCPREEEDAEIWNFRLNSDEHDACFLSLNRHFLWREEDTYCLWNLRPRNSLTSMISSFIQKILVNSDAIIFVKYEWADNSNLAPT